MEAFRVRKGSFIVFVIQSWRPDTWKGLKCQNKYKQVENVKKKKKKEMLRRVNFLVDVKVVVVSV